MGKSYLHVREHTAYGNIGPITLCTHNSTYIYLFIY